MPFAQNLQYLMEQGGLSNYQLAKDIECHQSSVSNWLNGTIPQKKMQKAIAEYFRVTVEQLNAESRPPIIPEIKSKPATLEDDEPIIILNRGAQKLTPEQRRQLLDVAKIMFEKEFKDE